MCHHHVCIVAEHGARGEITGALAIGRDITESKEAFRAVVEHSPY